jgi:LysM repeat protein
VLALIGICGCDPSAQSQADEAKEPHFLAGKTRVNTLDFEGAIECFEKALEANPQSASAHFELACIYDQKEADPSAAIYHYQHYLKLRPAAGNLDIVKQRILACKQELARTVSLGPVSEKIQRDLDALTQENKRLADENKKLHEDLDKWTAYASRLQTLTNNSPASTRSAQSVVAPATPLIAYSASVSTNLAKSNTIPANTAHSHSVKSGETPSSIAKRYGVRLEALMAANPRLDARRLQVGQTLVIPMP